MKVPEPRKLKSGSWFIQLRLGGESIPITALSKMDCKHQAEKIKAAYRAGESAKRAPETALALHEVIKRYIDAKSNVLSPSTIRGYNTILNYRFVQYAGQKAAKIDYQAMINAEVPLCASKTLVNAWNLIASSLRYSKIQVPEVTLPQVVSKEREWLTPEQIKIFVAAVKGRPCEIPALLALSSLRRSEIAGLTWNDIDTKAGTVTVNGATVYNKDNKLEHKDTNKNISSRRVVPIMMPELKAALKAAKKSGAQIAPPSPNTMREQINKACADCGLPLVGVHGLRHSFASLAYHIGMSELETMAIGGWSDYKTMRKIYTHLSDTDKQKAQNKMSKFYANANKTLTAT